MIPRDDRYIENSLITERDEKELDMCPFCAGTGLLLVNEGEVDEPCEECGGLGYIDEAQHAPGAGRETEVD